MDYYTLSLCRGLRKNGIQPLVFTSEVRLAPGDITVFFPFRGMFTIKSPAAKFLVYVAGTVKSIITSRQLSSAIVHFQLFETSAAHLASMVWHKMQKRKIVLTLHDIESFAGKTKYLSAGRLLLKLADRVIVHNDYSREKAMEKYRLKQETIVIIPHGNYNLYAKDGPEKAIARTRIGVSGFDHVLLFWGQIKPVKGLDILLNALPEVLKAYPKTVLVVAGKVWKDDFGYYENIINKNGLKDNVITRIGFIPDEEVPIFFSAADIPVLPYRDVFQSGVLMMAMTYGKPVLTSDIAAMKEIVKEDQTGFLFKSGDAKSLAQQLIRLLGDPAFRERVGNNGRELMLKEYDWNDIGKTTADLYRTIRG